MENTLQVTVGSVGGLGDGIADIDGKPLFIPKSCTGDHLRVRITKRTSQHLRGEIEEILTSGEDRTPPPCHHYADCGGCQLQHLNEEAYKNHKQRVVDQAIRQAGYETRADEMLLIPAGHRRRVEFRLHRENGVIKPAYFMPGTNDLLPIEYCLLLLPALQSLTDNICAQLTDWPYTPHIKSIKLTVLESGTEATLNLSQDISEVALVELAKSIPLTRLNISISGKKIETVFEDTPLTIRLGNYTIPLPPDSFLQATEAAQTRLTEIVSTYTNDASHIADLFCGIGTYGFSLPEDKKIVGVDLHSGMIKNLKTTIHKMGLAGRFSAKSHDLLKWPLSKDELSKFDAVIINPPRPGAKGQTENIAASGVGKVVMISCSPASWARDAKILQQAGFALDYVQGIDQFTYSPHLEIASVFSR